MIKKLLFAALALGALYLGLRPQPESKPIVQAPPGAHAPPPVDKAGTIDTALANDDSQEIRRAEDLAHEIIASGSAGELMELLPMLPQLQIEMPQESLCRIKDDPGFEIVKLKYERVFREIRPWSDVCKI